MLNYFRNSFVPGIIWFCIITFLFLLPKKELPQESWFEKIYLDKWAHFGFIFLLVLFTAVPAYFRSARSFPFRLGLLTTAAIIYSIAIEYLQKYLTPDRSFDVWDIVFDIAGALAAALLMCNHKWRSIIKR